MYSSVSKYMYAQSLPYNFYYGSYNHQAGNWNAFWHHQLYGEHTGDLILLMEKVTEEFEQDKVWTPAMQQCLMELEADLADMLDANQK